jgi:hypothetical protein
MGCLRRPVTAGKQCHELDFFVGRILFLIESCIESEGAAYAVSLG